MVYKTYEVFMFSKSKIFSELFSIFLRFGSKATSNAIWPKVWQTTRERMLKPYLFAHPNPINAIIKGQLISKRFFGVVHFLKKQTKTSRPEVS